MGKNNKAVLALSYAILVILLNNMMCSNKPSGSSVVASPYPLELGISFPPLDSVGNRNLALPYLQELKIKTVRLAENWKFRQANSIDPLDFSGLKDKLDYLKNNGINIFLTIQSHAAAWACTSDNQTGCIFNDLNKYKIYLKALFKFLKDNAYPVIAIQFGNEWQSTYWYPGTASDFIQANNITYDEAKLIFPTIPFVLGGFSINSLRNLAANNGNINSFYNDDATGKVDLYCKASAVICNGPFVELSTFLSSSSSIAYINRVNTIINGSKFDQADIHLYDDVENWAAYHKTVKDLIGTRDIIVTEFGGPWLDCAKTVPDCTTMEPAEPQQTYTLDYQATRLGQYISTINSLGVKTAYFFTLVDNELLPSPMHRKSGVLTYNASLVKISKKPSFSVLRSYR